MAHSPSGSDDDDDARRLADAATVLADGIEVALPAWVVTCCEAVVRAAGLTFDDELREQALAAGERARADIAPRVRALLRADIDEQHGNPLAIVRDAVRYPTEVLRAAGVPTVDRDRVAREQFPGDAYDLTPASFANLDPSLREPGIVWGAAKAHVHLRRHRGR